MKQTEGSTDLKQQREPEERYRRSHCNDFGPEHGFASLGDFYGQNTEGFWLWHKPRRAK